MKTAKWNYSGDVNMLDYGGTNFRHIGARKYQFVELINMDDACGRDNEGQPKYIVELRFVDLDAISLENIKRAVESCGMEKPGLDDDGNDTPPSDLIVAECCDSYGTHANLESWKGNNARQLLRAAYKVARSIAVKAGQCPAPSWIQQTKAA